MIDDKMLQRGIEGYMPTVAPDYPITFEPRKHENTFKTEQAKAIAIAEGRDPATVEPVFEDVDYYTIMIPGGDAHSGPVTDEERAKYPREWDAYKRGQQLTDGFPLREWGRMPREMKLRLELLNIFTVEQFISMPDTFLSQIGPEARRFQAEGRQLLGGRAYEEKASKEAELKNEVAELKEQVAQLIAAQQQAQNTNGKKGAGSKA
jgi:hypothetical protein